MKQTLIASPSHTLNAVKNEFRERTHAAHFWGIWTDLQLKGIQSDPPLKFHSDSNKLFRPLKYFPYHRVRSFVLSFCATRLHFLSLAAAAGGLAFGGVYARYNMYTQLTLRIELVGIFLSAAHTTPWPSSRKGVFIDWTLSLCERPLSLSLLPANTEKYKVISPSALSLRSAYTHNTQLKQVAAAFICERRKIPFSQEPAAIQPLTPSLLGHKFHALALSKAPNAQSANDT